MIVFLMMVMWHEIHEKIKSSDADVISKMPKPKFVACSVVGNETREVSHTERALIEASKLFCRKNFGSNSVLGRTETMFKLIRR